MNFGIMENRMEKNVEYEMETVVILSSLNAEEPSGHA